MFTLRKELRTLNISGVESTAWAQWKDFLLAAARALTLPILALRRFTPFKSARVMTNPPPEGPAAPRGDCLSRCGNFENTVNMLVNSNSIWQD